MNVFYQSTEKIKPDYYYYYLLLLLLKKLSLITFTLVCVFGRILDTLRYQRELRGRPRTDRLGDSDRKRQRRDDRASVDLQCRRGGRAAARNQRGQRGGNADAPARHRHPTEGDGRIGEYCRPSTHALELLFILCIDIGGWVMYITLRL